MTSAEEPPGTLEEPVDWMTYPHAELYRMVHEGLDLAGATSVSADWARMGEALGEIGDELSQIVQAFADAWEGGAAEQAQHAVASLATWAQETGQLAVSVSGCVTVEVDNAMHARNTMPPPMPADPLPWPLPKKPVPPDATVASSADFGSAPGLITDQTAIVGQRLEAHRQAAETMEQFQNSSLEVYNTVPQFSPPKIGPKPLGEDNPPAPPPPPGQPPTPTPAPGPVGRPTGAPVTVRGGGGGGAPVGGPVAAAPPAEPRLGAGPGTGLREVPPGSEAQRPAAASAGKTPGGGGMAGMPMGGMGAGQKQEDQEHKRKQRIKEDQDVWGLGDEPTSPPVIGEGRPRA
jgi:hypothetical protein